MTRCTSPSGITIHWQEPHTIQCWKGERLVSELTGLPLDACKHLANVHIALGYTSRIMSEGRDWCEVYKDGVVRQGRFAEVTLVHKEAKAMGRAAITKATKGESAP